MSTEVEGVLTRGTIPPSCSISAVDTTKKDLPLYVAKEHEATREGEPGTFFPGEARLLRNQSRQQQLRRLWHLKDAKVIAQAHGCAHHQARGRGHGRRRR